MQMDTSVRSMLYRNETELKFCKQYEILTVIAINM
uniref:Uncharacterized protein n=1 Tax=Anguilla anguilla TaxID=7936 RepID=A0A0E9RZP5_ANGAN